MGDKCDSHDKCFERLYTKVEDIDGKLDDLFRGLRERLHDGDLRFVQLEMRLAQCEKLQAASQSNRLDVKRKATSVAFDLLKMAVVALFGAACWAIANGYKG